MVINATPSPESHLRQDQLNAILSSMAEGLIAVDREEKVILMNQAAGIMLRLAPQAAIGRDIREIFQLERASFSVDQNQPIAPPVTRAIREKNIISVNLIDDLQIRNSAGGTFPIAMMAAPLLVEGEVDGAIIIFRDITRDKEVDRAKTEFVSLASHQLKTPLSAINWYAETMLEQEIGKLNRKQKEYLENLYSSNRRMIELVNSLLNVSRIDLGTFAVEPKPTDLRQIADSVIAEFNPVVAEKRIELAKLYAADLPSINVDPKLTRIIFQNYLSNAIKYTPPGGTVTVELSKVGGEIVWRVADSGFGIPAADHHKIFTKLFRSENVREQEADGTGLGLYIVKSIMEAVGGRVWFDSLEGQGSTFYAALPLAGMPARSGAKGLI